MTVLQTELQQITNSQVFHWRYAILLHVMVCYIDLVRRTISIIDDKVSSVFARSTGQTVSYQLPKDFERSMSKSQQILTLSSFLPCRLGSC